MNPGIRMTQDIVVTPTILVVTAVIDLDRPIIVGLGLTYMKGIRIAEFSGHVRDQTRALALKKRLSRSKNMKSTTLQCYKCKEWGHRANKYHS